MNNLLTDFISMAVSGAIVGAVLYAIDSIRNRSTRERARLALCGCSLVLWLLTQLVLR